MRFGPTLLLLVAALLAGPAAGAFAQAPSAAQTLTPAGFRALRDATASARRQHTAVARATATPSLADDRRAADRAVRDCRALGDRATFEVLRQRDLCTAGALADRALILASGRCLRHRWERLVRCLATALDPWTAAQEALVADTRRFADRLASGGCRSLFLDRARVAEGSIAATRQFASAIRARDSLAVLEALDVLRREGERSGRFARRALVRRSACAPAGP